jgi:hypothetical protein
MCDDRCRILRSRQVQLTARRTIQNSQTSPVDLQPYLPHHTAEI